MLRYGVELADALDHAHRRGLVHRDLKPGNVMVTNAGAKLLDFGVSRLQSGTGLLALSTISPGGAPLTADGAVLGTYPYMAPEQLMGREADARSDIFAFGALLYEMATGRRAFDGATAATAIGAILHTDPPPPSSVQPLAPAAFDRLVSRCLAKDPDDRWQTARDLTLELKWIVEHDAPAIHARERQHHLELVASAAAAVAVLAIAALVFNVTSGGRTPVQNGAVRLTFSPPKDLKLGNFRSRGPVTVSPDGRRLVYAAAGADGRQMLRVHPLDSPSAQTLAGTEGAQHPFWSPDGRLVGFFAQGKLKTIDATAGLPQTLCDVVLPSGGTWSRDDVIVFAANAGEHLYRVSLAGGAADRTDLLAPESREPLARVSARWRSLPLLRAAAGAGDLRRLPPVQRHETGGERTLCGRRLRIAGVPGAFQRGRDGRDASGAALRRQSTRADG